jgi:hypothetical protein
VDFVAAELFEWATAIETRDNRCDYGEKRWVALGLIAGCLHVLIYGFRSGKIRLISLRRANRRDRDYYEKTQA